MSTIYSKTDNYALNLYGDADPADLRDGYNDSMRTIDTTMEQHLNRIESVEARETHDEAVVKALLGDNTVDNATNAKIKWDKAAADAVSAGEYFSTMGIDSVAAAERFAQNVGAFVTAESIGCKANDPSFDNAAILNQYFDVEGKNLVFAKGDYYFSTPMTMMEPSTILFTGNSRLHVADGVTLDTAVEITSTNRWVLGRNPYIDMFVVDNGESALVLKVNNVYTPITFNIHITNVVHTGMKTSGCTGLNGYIKVIGKKDVMAEVGIDIGSTDDTWDTVIPVNCKKGLVLHSGGSHFNVVHPWSQSNTSHYTLIGMEIATASVTIDNFVNDALGIGILSTSGSLHISSYISYGHQSLTESVEISGNGASIRIADSMLDSPAKKFIDTTNGVSRVYIGYLSPWVYHITQPNVNDTDLLLPQGNFIVRDVTEGSPLLKATQNLMNATISVMGTNDGSTLRATITIYAMDGIHYALLNDGIVHQNTNWKHLLFS